MAIGTTRQRAVWYAGDIVCLLWRKTGKPYVIKEYPLGKVKRLEIREQTNDCDGSYRLVVYYQARTWVGLCDILHAAYDTYLTIQNA
jgi:hypothetical protein